MSTSAERLKGTPRREFGGLGRTEVHEGELERHPSNVRFVHWMVALTFTLALLTGFAIYSAWLFHWIAPLFGGGPMTRLLHPWFALAFILFLFVEIKHWLSAMSWTDSDRKWMRQMKQYVSNEEKLSPEYVGFFNGGQKLYFWVTVYSGILFLLTGIIMWFPEVFGRVLVAVSYVLHDIAALAMLAGFILHVYLSTVFEPGTFRSMTRGTVTREWAWTHHPAWYKEATGRDPRHDYETASRETASRGPAERGPAPPGA